jgi:hypothetical protein
MQLLICILLLITFSNDCLCSVRSFLLIIFLTFTFTFTNVLSIDKNITIELRLLTLRTLGAVRFSFSLLTSLTSHCLSRFLITLTWLVVLTSKTLNTLNALNPLIIWALHIFSNTLKRLVITGSNFITLQMFDNLRKWLICLLFSLIPSSSFSNSFSLFPSCRLVDLSTCRLDVHLKQCFLVETFLCLHPFWSFT